MTYSEEDVRRAVEAAHRVSIRMLAAGYEGAHRDMDPEEFYRRVVEFAKKQKESDR